MENKRQHRIIKLVTTERRKNYLVTEPSYHTKNFLSENLLAIEMRKTKILLSNPVYLGLSILGLRKNAMREFWYNYVKPKYGKNVKLCIWIQVASLFM